MSLTPTPAHPLVRFHALVPCAGTGSRAGLGQPKQYHPLAGQPLVMHTLTALAAVPGLQTGWVVVSAQDDFKWPDGERWPAAFRRVPCGGAERAISVHQGLGHMLAQGLDPQDWVLVHDAARCLISVDAVQDLLTACAHDPVGGLLALPLPDTLKREREGRVHHTVPRHDKWLAQTPQMFRLGALHQALQAASLEGYAGITDEASAMERQGLHPRLVVGAASNIKITYPSDFEWAEIWLQHHRRPA